MLAVLCLLLVGADPIDPQQKLKAAVDAYRAQAITTVEAALAESRDRKETAALKNKLKDLRSNKPLVPQLFPRQLAKGAIGEWVGGFANRAKGPGSHHFEIVQVIDEQNALVRSTNSHPVNEAGRAVFSPSTILWVTSHDFSDAVDGGFVSLDGLYEVLETRRYDTAVGTRTVWVVKKFSDQ